MTSLIFWGPYMAHKGVINHRREKQRVKNYERWEGLRDEYDDQRRATRSLDIDRTGSWSSVQANTTGQSQYPYDDRPILSQRDLQERNDARTSWRPQECWESPKTQMQAQMTGQTQQTHPQAQRHVSMTPETSGLPLRSQKTGAAWDEGLPPAMQVSRRSFDDYDATQRYRPVTQSTPVSRQPSQSRHSSIPRESSANVSRTHTPSGLRESSPFPDPARQYTPPNVQTTNLQELQTNEFGFVEPARQLAGGRMAELIERGY